MSNWKMVLGVVLGSFTLIGVMVFGLTRMGDGQTELDVSPDRLVDGAGWILGGDNYKVTVVEFADFQCPACKQAEPVALELRQTEGVRYVFRHLPLLTIHKNAWAAAKGAEAAKRMDKGWEMMELLFEKQEDWSESNNFNEKVVGYAKELGLAEAGFDDFYGDKEVEIQVVRDNALARELRLGGTPTFFVNGEQVATKFVLARVKDILESK